MTEAIPSTSPTYATHHESEHNTRSRFRLAPVVGGPGRTVAPGPEPRSRRTARSDRPATDHPKATCVPFGPGPFSTWRPEGPLASPDPPNRPPPGDPKTPRPHPVRRTVFHPATRGSSGFVRSGGVVPGPAVRKPPDPFGLLESPGTRSSEDHPVPCHSIDTPDPVIHRDVHNRCIVGARPPPTRRFATDSRLGIGTPTARRPAGSPDPITRSEHRPQAPVSRASRLLRLPFGVATVELSSHSLTPWYGRHGIHGLIRFANLAAASRSRALPPRRFTKGCT
jgi:hypothetical protein